jgi:hypothetical protein
MWERLQTSVSLPQATSLSQKGAVVSHDLMTGISPELLSTGELEVTMPPPLHFERSEAVHYTG